MRPLARSCFFLLLLGRLFLSAIPCLLRTCLPLLWSSPSPLHLSPLIILSLAKVRLSLTLTPFSTLRSGALDRRLSKVTECGHSVPQKKAFHKSATSLFFSFYLTLAPFSPSCFLLLLSFYLNLSDRFGRNCLVCPLVLSNYNGYPDTRFSRVTMQIMSLLNAER